MIIWENKEKSIPVTIYAIGTGIFKNSLDNRLTSVETVNPQAMHPGIELPKASYGYDALGRRVLSETVNPPNPGYGNLETEREVYRYDGRSFNIAEVYNMVDPLMGRSDKTESYEYQYAGRSLLSVEEIQENQRYRNQNTSDNNVTRYFQDSLGSTITTVTGNRKENYTYSVFGSNMEGDLENAYMVGYNGKRQDEVTGFYNYGFRDYSPEMMRFTTEDPIRSGLNWYVYVNNDPVNKIDLWGLTESDKLSVTDEIKQAIINSPPGQIIGASKDFINQYFTMREENIIGNDHYNHAVANSKATQRGPYGETTAGVLSDLREAVDYLTGDTRGDSREDQAANEYGRAIPEGVSPEGHNAIFDTRRGGSRATVESEPDDDKTFIADIKEVFSTTQFRLTF